MLYDLMHDLDIELFEIINSLPHTAILDSLAYVIWSYLWLILCILAAVLYVVLRRSEKYLPVLALGALVLTAGINQYLLKPSFGRYRPFYKLEHLQIVYDNLTDYSFPSGHAASVMAFSLPLLLLLKNRHLKFELVFLVFLTGLDRIYMGHHYPSDVVSGFLLGGGIGLIVVSLWRLQTANKLRK